MNIMTATTFVRGSKAVPTTGGMTRDLPRRDLFRVNRISSGLSFIYRLETL